MGLFYQEVKRTVFLMSCFPVMEVIPVFPHKINENSNLTQLETLELALLEQHKLHELYE